MRLIYFLFFFILCVFGFVFCLKNLAPVTVDFYIAKFDIPLAVVMTAELIAGVLIGMAVRFSRILQLRSECAKLRKRLVSAEKETKRLQVLSNNQTD